MSEFRQCCKCRELRPLTAFHKNRTRKDGLQPECKFCRNAHYDLSIKRKEMLNRGMCDCRKCKRWLPFSEFHKDSSKEKGICDNCKTCVQEYHYVNREYLSKKSIEWQRANPERTAVHARTYYKRHPEKFKSEAIREKNRYRSSIRRATDPDYMERRRAARRRSINKRYLNDEEYRLYSKVKNAKRRAKEKGNGGSYTLAEWRELCERYENKCLRCGKAGTYKTLTFDHVIPVVAGGNSDISNGQPLCKSCNSSKGAKSTDYRPY